MTDLSSGSPLCIYCRNATIPSQEHVLQKSLGGDLTTLSDDTQKPVVCKVCNGAFSSIDQALAERSLVAMQRIAETDPAKFFAQLGGAHFHYDAKHALWLEVHVVNGVRPHLPPQLHYRDGHVLYLGSSTSEKDEFVQLVTKRHNAKSLRNVFIKVGPADRCTTARLVQHRSNDLFMRAPDEAAGRSFLALLEAKWDVLSATLTSGTFSSGQTEHPAVEITIPVRLDDVYRAVAKTAFNFLAARQGGAFVLRHEFDPIRDYIRGITIEHPAMLEPGELAVDTRFVVEARTEDDTEVPLIVPTTSHAVGFFYDKPNLLGIVILYASAPSEDC